MVKLDEAFWNERYDAGKTGWDIGYVSTPLKAYFDQLEDKELKILIPGAGNAYEAEYLHHLGFKNIHVVEISSRAIDEFLARYPAFPANRIIHADFFNFLGQYDLIIEQTFFCAIAPQLRSAYVKHAHQLLKKSGKLVGVLFNIPLNDDKPPFGGKKADYQPLFSPYFKLKIFEKCYNSIPPREGNELFIKCIKK